MRGNDDMFAVASAQHHTFDWLSHLIVKKPP